MTSSIPYLGSKISLVSKSEIRYEGILYTIDTKESTVALAKVKSFGTEDRPTERPVAPRDEVYEYIIFRASDIKDLHVCEPPKHTTNSGLPNDPAIVQHSAPVSSLPSAAFSPSSSTGSYGPIGALPSYHQPYTSPPSGLGNLPQPFVTPGSQHSDSRSETPTTTPQQRKSPTLDGNIPPGPVGSRIESKENKPPPMEQRQGLNKGGIPSYSQGSSHYQRRSAPQAHHRLQPQQQHQHQQQQHQHQHRQHSPQRGRPQRRGRSQGRNRPNYPGRSKVLQFDGEYDFEQANAEFQELEGKLAKIKLDSPTSNSYIDHDHDEKKDEQPWSDNASGDAGTEDDDSQVYYDKTKSFFDNISCEALERSKGLVCYDKTKSFFDNISCKALEHSKGNVHRHDWRQEKKLNVETFGVSSSNNWRRNGWRGRGGYRGRGGGSYHRGSNRGGYSYRGFRPAGGGGGDRAVPNVR